MKALLVALAALLPALAPVPPATAATAPAPPLAASWHRAIPSTAAHASDGERIYLASHAFTETCAIDVRGLDPRTGRTAWLRRPLAGSCSPTRLAAGGGRAFVVANGVMAALRSDTGALVWRRRLARDDAGAPPLATPSAVYVVGRDSWSMGEEVLLAIDPATGAERWRHAISAPYGDGSPLAVTASELYVAMEDCSLLALDRRTGAQRWLRRYPCRSGGFHPELLLDGDRLIAWYSEHDGFVVQRAGGASIRRFESFGPPARAPGGRLLVSGRDELRAEDVVSGASRWRFTGEPPGDLPVDGWRRPLVVGTTAYFADEEERLYGLDSATGLPRWRGRLPTLASDPWRDERLLPLGAYGGTLLAATEDRLAGFRPGRPEAEILTGPPATTPSDRAVFTFRTNAGRRTWCQLDFEHEVPCGSPHTLRMLSPGAHTLRIRHQISGPIPAAPSVAWRWTVTAPPPPPLPGVGGPFPGWDDTVLVSRATGVGAPSTGGGSQPTQSCTGRYVAFASGDGLVPGRPSAHRSEVLVRDLALGVTLSASYGTTGVRLSEDYGAGDPSISGDGRRVAFIADDPAFSLEDADGEATPDHPGPYQVYVRDLTTGRTVLASRATGPAGAPAAAASENPVISADGRYVAFVTSAQLDPRDQDGGPGREGRTVYLRDLVLQRTTMIGTGIQPSISGRGSRIAYRLLYPEGTRRAGVYLHDRAAGTTRLISGGRQSAGEPAISADGRRIAYTARSITGGTHVSVYDVPTATTRLASRARGLEGRAARGYSLEPAITADGGKVAFTSEDPELDPYAVEEEFGPTAYVRDLRRGTTHLVSRDRGSHGRGGGYTYITAAISGDGTSASFVTDSQLLHHVPDAFITRTYARGIADRSEATAALCAGPVAVPLP